MEIGGKVGEKTVLLLNALYDYEDDTRIADKRKPVQDILDEANLSDYERETKRISEWLKEQVAIISDIYLEGNPIWLEMDRDLQAALLILSEKAFAVKIAADVAEATAKASAHLAVENKIAILRGETTQQIIDRHTEWTAAMESGDFVMAGLLTTLYGLEDAAGDATTAIQGLQDALGLAETAVKAAYQAEKDRITVEYNDRKDHLDKMKGLLERSFSAEMQTIRDGADETITALTGNLDTVKEKVSALSSAVSALSSAADKMSSGGRSAITAAISGLTALAGAVRAGDTSGLDSMGKYLDTVSADNAQYYSSFDDYQRDFMKAKIAISDLKSVSVESLSTEEQMVKLYESQIELAKEAADAQIEALQNQLDGILGVDKSVVSVGAAIAAYSSAQMAVDAFGYDAQITLLERQLDGLMGISTSVLSLADAIKGFVSAKNAVTPSAYSPTDPIAGLYQSILGRAPDTAGYAYWADELSRGVMTIPGMAEAFKQSPEYMSSLPKFAIGTNYLQSDGPIYAHKGEEITPRPYVDLQRKERADQVAETREMKEEIKMLRYALSQIAKNTGKTVDQLRRWDGDGLPVERSETV
jgi:hypothetical protein